MRPRHSTIGVWSAAIATLATLVACDNKPKTAAPAGPDIQAREVAYTVGATPLTGFVAWDASRTGPRPGVIVVHEWWGHNAHVRNQARRLAESGYVGFALDMYGNGRSTTHPDSAQSFMMTALGDQAAMQARFAAALAQLKADPHVDSTRIAAIGYCFGGLVVLSQARAGAPLAAVASFHGAIPQAAPIASGAVKARVLIMTGSADPMVPPAQVDSFATAMRAAGADVQVITYPGARHGFSNPRADSAGMAGLKYDSEADRQSWASLLKLLGEVFPS